MQCPCYADIAISSLELSVKDVVKLGLTDEEVGCPWRHLTRRLSKPAASCLAIALRIEHVVDKGKNSGSRVSVPSHRCSPVREGILHSFESEISEYHPHLNFPALRSFPLY